MPLASHVAKFDSIVVDNNSTGRAEQRSSIFAAQPIMNSIVVCQKDHTVIKANNVSGLCKYVFTSYVCIICAKYIHICMACRGKTYSVAESHGHLLTCHDGNHYLRNKVYNYTYLIEKDKLPGLEYLRYLDTPIERRSLSTYLSADKHEKYDMVKLSYMKDHFCIFCRDIFDCLPTEELMNNHLRNCSALMS